MKVHAVAKVRLDADGRVTGVEWGPVNTQTNEWHTEPRVADVSEVVDALRRGEDVFALFRPARARARPALSRRRVRQRLGHRQSRRPAHPRARDPRHAARRGLMSEGAAPPCSSPACAPSGAAPAASTGRCSTSWPNVRRPGDVLLDRHRGRVGCARRSRHRKLSHAADRRGRGGSLSRPGHAAGADGRAAACAVPSPATLAPAARPSLVASALRDRRAGAASGIS